MQPTASLAVLIYNFAGMPFPNQVELAWAAALVLVLLVLAANLARPEPVDSASSAVIDQGVYRDVDQNRGRSRRR